MLWQPRMQLAFITTRAHCRFTISLSSRPPRPFSTELLSVWVMPSLYTLAWVNPSQVKDILWPMSNSSTLVLGHPLSLSVSQGMAAWPPAWWPLPTLISSTDVLRVASLPKFRLLTERMIKCWQLRSVAPSKPLIRPSSVNCFLRPAVQTAVTHSVVHPSSPYLPTLATRMLFKTKHKPNQTKKHHSKEVGHSFKDAIKAS